MVQVSGKSRRETDKHFLPISSVGSNLHESLESLLNIEKEKEFKCFHPALQFTKERKKLTKSGICKLSECRCDYITSLYNMQYRQYIKLNWFNSFNTFPLCLFCLLVPAIEFSVNRKWTISIICSYNFKFCSFNSWNCCCYLLWIIKRHLFWPKCFPVTLILIWFSKYETSRYEVKWNLSVSRLSLNK